MAKWIGRQLSLGIGRETVRGVGVASTFWIPKTDLSFDDTVTQARVQSGLGTLEDSEQSHMITKFAEGDFGGEVRHNSIGLLLYAMLGSIATSGPTDSAYTHNFSLLNSVQHPSLSLTMIDGNNTERYTNCMLNSLELSQGLENVLTYTASLMGRTSKGASDTPAYVSEAKFTKRHFKLKLATNLAGLSSATAISVKEFSIAFTKNVSADNALGTAEPEDFNNQSMAIEGSFKLNYIDETYKNYTRNNTYRAMEVSWTNTDTDAIIGVSTSPRITLQFPKVDFFSWQPNMALDEIASQGISFKANADLSGGNSAISTCSLVNTTVSY